MMQNFDFITAHNEVGIRLCFYICLWFCSQGDVISKHALQVVSQHALLVSKGWGWYPSMSCRFPGPHPGGAWVVWPGGSPDSHPGGSQGVWPGGLQANTWGEVKGSGLGEVSRPTPGGSPGPHPGGSPAPHLEGVYPSMYCRQLLLQVVCILLECILVFCNIYHITRIVDI